MRGNPPVPQKLSCSALDGVVNPDLIIIGSLLVVGALVLGWLIARTRPTNGDKIADYANPQRAVVVIDVQED